MRRSTDPTLWRIVAVWAVLAALGATFVVLRSSDRAARIDAARSDAQAVAAQAASLTANELSEEQKRSRNVAETLFRDGVDTETIARAAELMRTEIAVVIDPAAELVLGLGSPIATINEPIDLDLIVEYLPETRDALNGRDLIVYLDLGLGEGEETLVGMFTHFLGPNRTPMLFATGAGFERSVYAPLLDTRTPGHVLQLLSADDAVLFSPSDRSSPLPMDPQGSVVGRAAVAGTNWVVVSQATYADLGLASPFNSTPATALLALVFVGLLGWLSTRAIRAASHVEAAYEQVAWAAHQQSEFTAVVAHELRTPATSSSGLAAFLAARWDDMDDERRRDLAQRVASSTQDLARLVSDLRLANGFDSGPVSLTPTARDIGGVIERAIVDSNVDPTMVHVEGDLEAMAIVDVRFVARALASLIGNAASHGAGPIDVTARRADGEVLVTVRDHGDGVPTDFVPLLFEPFTQARSHLRRTHRGTGLGLHLVRAIVEQMGGRVEHRHADPGAEFLVRLPSGTSSAAASSTSAAIKTTRRS